MSEIPEEVVAAVVGEVSQRMTDPAYAQVAIGSFVQAHPNVGRFITAHLDDLGGGEGVMHAVFHAEVLHECYRHFLKRHMTPIGFVELDAVSTQDALKNFERAQPALANYIGSNVDDPAMRSLLALIGLAMDRHA